MATFPVAQLQPFERTQHAVISKAQELHHAFTAPLSRSHMQFLLPMALSLLGTALSLRVRSAALYLSAPVEVKCALYEACLFPHTHLMAPGWCLAEPRVWIRPFHYFERIFNCKPEEPSRYSSSLKCIWSLYGVGLLGVFCPSLTGVNVKAFRFLKVQVYGCASCGTSNMYLLLKMQKLTPTIPLVLLKNILVSTKDSWDLLGRITTKCNSISVCQVFPLLEMCDGLGGSQFLGDWYFRDVLSRDQGKLDLS